MLTFLITANITGAIVYSIIDPTGYLIFSDYGKGKAPNNETSLDTARELRTWLKFILSCVLHSLFIVTWIIGVFVLAVKIPELVRKVRYGIKYRADASYLSDRINVYLFSEMEIKQLSREKLEELINADIERLEELYNEYNTRLDSHGELYHIKYQDAARTIFKRRAKLKIKE